MFEANQPIENLNQLIYLFFKGNLDFSLKTEDVQKMDWHWQRSFLNATMNSELLNRYPVNSQFTKLFLKKLISYLELKQDIHDDMYAQLCASMNMSTQNEFYYRHYIIGKCLDNIITMKETNKMVVNGTTGLKTWEAALVLSDWALCNPEIFSNKNVLELGSGVGFAGITIGKMCDVKSLYLTDYHNEVLKTISENIHINFPHFRKENNDDIIVYKKEMKSIGVMMLDWNNINNLEISFKPDIIIGADIVYDPTILQSLCNVIKRFSINKNLEVYIASIIRNEETFSNFLKTLDTMNFKWEKIEKSKCVFIDWDESVNKCLLKITFKS